jgi:hypothetical protein
MTAPSAARPHRSHVRIDARLTRACGNSEVVAVEDLSIDGCSVRGWFQAGEKVTLALPRIGSFAADVRWASRGRAGLRFDRGVAE